MTAHLADRLAPPKLSELDAEVVEYYVDDFSEHCVVIDVDGIWTTYLVSDLEVRHG